ncbi:MAG TPA: hypothetical protein VGQ35_06800 [Dongiaceae bacterium]|nr:hypothetical protein [Dongiaceae bacterium]
MLTRATETAQPVSFRDVIARWPATRSFARDAGCSPTLVRQWRHRDFVPAHYWPRIVEGAGRRGIALINVNLLAQLAVKRRMTAKGERT